MKPNMVNSKSCVMKGKSLERSPHSSKNFEKEEKTS